MFRQERDYCFVFLEGVRLWECPPLYDLCTPFPLPSHSHPTPPPHPLHIHVIRSLYVLLMSCILILHTRSSALTKRIWYQIMYGTELGCRICQHTLVVFILVIIHPLIRQLICWYSKPHKYMYIAYREKMDVTKFSYTMYMYVARECFDMYV